MTPYYSVGTSVIYHGDALEVFKELVLPSPAALVTDPPYGIGYHSNHPRREGNSRNIVGDSSTQVRDSILEWWAHRGPALVFGTWRIPRPQGTKGVLVWDKGGALGSGDLNLPWKFDHEEIYVLCGPWTGRRDSGSVLRHPPVQAVGRDHPHEKPVGLMSMLLAKVPYAATILDPCCGVGPVLVAAKARGRIAIGVEVEERYCEIAARRLDQGALDFGGVAS